MPEFVTTEFAFEVEERKGGTSSRTVPVVASTSSLDDYGTIIEQNWKLDRYAKNPVVLWNHSSKNPFATTEEKLPIGRGENVRIEGGELRADIVFADEKANPLAEKVFQGVQQKTIRGISVGFRIGSARVSPTDEDVLVLSECELYELSVVPIPSNPDTLASMRASALKSARASRSQPRTTETKSMPEANEVRAASAELAPSLPVSTLAGLLGCEQNEATVIRSASGVPGLKVRAALAVTMLVALGLPESATEAEATKAIKDLSGRAAKGEGVEKELIDLRAFKEERDGADSTNEVNFIVKHGKRYGFTYDDKAKKALAAYRKADPKGFAEEFKSALDGMRAHDDPTLFESTTGPGGKLSVPKTNAEAATRAASGGDGDAADAEYDRKVKALVERCAKAGRPISRSKAMEMVAEGRDETDED